MPERTQWQCGSLVQPLCVQGETATFLPITNHATIVGQISSWEETLDGVVYPRVVRLNQSDSGPLVPEPWFSLPPTHYLTTTDSIDSVSADLIIELFGFLLGVPLRPKGWGYLHPVAVREGRWVDFSLCRNDTRRVLDHIVRGVTGGFPTNTMRSVRAGVNAYFLSASQEQPYQRVAALYMAIDRACDALGVRGSADYSIHKMTVSLFKYLNIQPIGHFASCYECDANSHKRPGSETTIHNMVRNDLIHYGEFNNYHQVGVSKNGRPLIKRSSFNVIGEAHPPAEYEVELSALASRALVAAMGLTCRYTSSDIGTRQIYGLDLI